MKLKEALRHYFVPHERNDYKPHFFREISITVILSATVLLFAASAGTSFLLRKTNLGAAVLPAVLIDLTNQSRTGNGELALAKSSVLETAAGLKANDMAQKSYFAHTSPDGVTPWHWFAVAGYNFIYAGENLAINFNESSDVENAWLASPTHRANILNGQFTEIGIATKDGMYNGMPTTFVVQEFGTPLSFTVSAPETPDTAPTSTPASLPQPAPKNTILAENAPASAVSAPVVKGETTTEVQNLQTIAEMNNFIAVKNIAVSAPVQSTAPSAASSQTPAPKYSTWPERLLVFGPNYVSILYLALLAVVFVAFVLMIVIEIKKQHPKNIFYGVLLLFILISLAYINQMVFIPHFML